MVVVVCCCVLCVSGIFGGIGARPSQIASHAISRQDPIETMGESRQAAAYVRSACQLWPPLHRGYLFLTADLM